MPLRSVEAASRDDAIVRHRNMRDFAEQLRARGAALTFVTVPGGHGTAFQQPAALSAITSFVAQRSAR